jgi:hypothetical protein
MRNGAPSGIERILSLPPAPLSSRVPWLSCLYCNRAGGATVLAPASTEILYWMSFCDAVLDLAYIVDASAVDHRTPEQHAACPGGLLATTPRDGKC